PEVPGPRVLRHRRQPAAGSRRLLASALALPRDLRRVLPAPGPGADAERIARPRSLAHLGYRAAGRRAAEGLLRERAAAPAVAEGVDRQAARGAHRRHGDTGGVADATHDDPGVGAGPRMLRDGLRGRAACRDT